MKNFICKKCGNTTYIVQEKSNGTGVATGLYCAKCGTWHKWLNKQEKVLYSVREKSDKDKEIARLTAENDKLRERLENAIELPTIYEHTIYPFIENSYTETIYYVVYKENGRIISINCGKNKPHAESRLAELRGGRE